MFLLISFYQIQIQIKQQQQQQQQQQQKFKFEFLQPMMKRSLITDTSMLVVLVLFLLLDVIAGYQEKHIQGDIGIVGVVSSSFKT